MPEHPLYLILHRARGEPAFDIAIKVQIGNEDGWIIPTSGHRAYPYQTWDMSLWTSNSWGWFDAWIREMPYDLPDHYSITREPSISEAKLAQALLDSLGICPEPKQRFVRVRG